MSGRAACASPHGLSIQTSPDLAATTCGVIIEGYDLKGGDVAGPKNGATIADCCTFCAAIQGCTAITFVKGVGICYFKGPTGWNQQANPSLQSVIISGSGVIPAPAPPGVVPQPSPPPTPAAPPGQYVYVPLTKDQERRMFQLTSIFENADVSLAPEAELAVSDAGGGEGGGGAMAPQSQHPPSLGRLAR